MVDPDTITTAPDRPPIRLPDGTVDWGTVSLKDDPLSSGGGSALRRPVPGEGAAAAEQELRGVQEEGRAQQRGYLDAQDRRFAELEGYERSHPIPRPPPLQNVGPPPDARDYQKHSMEFMAATAMVVMFANRTGGASATDSLNAFAGAMKGWGEGNEQAYTNAAARWKQSVEATKENNANALKSYDLIIKDRSLHTGEMLERIKAAAVLNNDHIMYNKAKQEDVLGIYKLRDAQEQAAQKYNTAAEPFLKDYEAREAKNKSMALKLAPIVANDFKDANGNEYVKPDGTPLTDFDKRWAKTLVDAYPLGSTAEGGPPLTDDGLMRMVENRLLGMPESQVLAGVGRGTQGRIDQARYRNKLAEVSAARAITPEMQQAKDNEYARKRALATSEGRSTGTGVAALETIIRNAHEQLPAVLAASEKIERGRWVRWNELKQKGLREISDPDMKEFKQRNLETAELWARAMNPRGIMRESDRNFALEILNTADSREAYRRSIKVLNNYLEREMQALNDQKAGKPMPHWDPDEGFDASTLDAKKHKAEILGGGGDEGGGKGGGGGNDPLNIR